jgi:hypothetical protein
VSFGLLLLCCCSLPLGTPIQALGVGRRRYTAVVPLAAFVHLFSSSPYFPAELGVLNVLSAGRTRLGGYGRSSETVAGATMQLSSACLFAQELFHARDRLVRRLVRAKTNTVDLGLDSVDLSSPRLKLSFIYKARLYVCHEASHPRSPVLSLARIIYETCSVVA